MTTPDTTKPTDKDVGGRPATVINYETLKTLCGLFCTGEECAAVLGISYNTLDRRLKEDYADALAEFGDDIPHQYSDGFVECFKKHSANGRASLRKAQFVAATRDKNPNTAMQIWLGKNYLDQADKIDHSSKDGTMSPVRRITRTIVDPKIPTKPPGKPAE
jgi:hypothetical protein